MRDWAPGAERGRRGRAGGLSSHARETAAVEPTSAAAAHLASPAGRLGDGELGCVVPREAAAGGGAEVLGGGGKAGVVVRRGQVLLATQQGSVSEEQQMSEQREAGSASPGAAAALVLQTFWCKESGGGCRPALLSHPQPLWEGHSGCLGLLDRGCVGQGGDGATAPPCCPVWKKNAEPGKSLCVTGGEGAETLGEFS
ncbi:uncharacterized protein ACIGJ3_021095 [Trichechus inunguis]